MLAVPPLRNTRDERESEVVEKFCLENDEFLNFSGEILLDSIDFDDLFVRINDGDLLPDLEMDPHILAAEFSVSGDEESTETNGYERVEEKFEKEGEDKSPASCIASGPSGHSGSSLNQGEKIVSKGVQSAAVSPSQKGASAGKGTKSSAQSKNPQGKRKVKVDWTPDLHRRFVQAVEQLGVDKAVPSKILELMGIDCLTRHNIASHLQKYRSHQKHLLAREAEAASWSQRRQVFGVSSNGVGSKRDMANSWLAPTMGFPPMAPLHHFRPLHVWGHPSMDQSLMQYVWPKHLAPSTFPPPPPLPACAPTPPSYPPAPSRDPSFWHSHHYPRFHTPPVPGFPPHAMFKVDSGIAVPTAPTGQTYPHPPFDCHPSTESIDAAIGDVLSKPWLPLPLGLKPPSTDGVLVELQHQGISKIPPTCV